MSFQQIADEASIQMLKYFKNMCSLIAAFSHLTEAKTLKFAQKLNLANHISSLHYQVTQVNVHGKKRRAPSSVQQSSRSIFPATSNREYISYNSYDIDRYITS